MSKPMPSSSSSKKAAVGRALNRSPLPALGWQMPAQNAADQRYHPRCSHWQTRPQNRRCRFSRHAHSGASLASCQPLRTMSSTPAAVTTATS